MPIYAFEDDEPRIDPGAFVAAEAVLIGDVTIEDGASIWPMAVLRADHAPIVVRAGANVQEGSVVHGPMPTEIGPEATIGHLCLVHGATLGEQALIGNGATVLDGARIGRRAMVGAGALIPAGFEVPDETLAVGVPATIKGPIAGTAAEFWVNVNPAVYRELAKRHASGLRRLD